MSLETGKKLGTTASLMAVITPVIGVVAYFFLFLSIFATIPLRANSTSFFHDFIIILFAVIGIIAFAGFILFVVAMRRLSEYYNEPDIYKNTLYGFIINVVGAVTILVIYIALQTSIMHSLPQGNIQTTAATPIPTVPPALLNSVGLLISSVFVIFGIALLLGVVSAVFYMRAFNKLGEKSGVENFKTVGLLYLLGIVLSVVVIGVLLVWIAWILALIGFRSLKPKATETSTFAYASPSPPPTMTDLLQKRYCPYCGTENNPGSMYCRSCGKQLQ